MIKPTKIAGKFILFDGGPLPSTPWTIYSAHATMPLVMSATLCLCSAIVFKEVVPMVAEMIVTEAERLGIDPQALRRLWLHQANAGMNRLIAQRVLGHEASADESPTVLDTYANTSSAGSIIAFHKHHEDLSAGDTGLICSFGAGYSAGAVFVRKVG